MSYYLKLETLANIVWSCRTVRYELSDIDSILKLNKAKTSLKGSITRIETSIDNLSKHVQKTKMDVKLKKIDQLQKKIEELKEIFFGIETATPNDEAKFQEDLDSCEKLLEDLEIRVKK
ncbi:hypothetical protein TNIN_204321 [Trichonephila inaurata madagascariensis]|uniref:Uncharacterized protein n=1 Tax=Trichonephila inaurata madagascariensis TaxID=2747483 RepID=A0A8X7CEB4_9ARAC|nr:hypothetical protein TNIN_204321 [Trichonephila inaurata madagascariensis]